MDRTNTTPDDSTQAYTEADAVVGGGLGWLFILVGSAAVAAAALIPNYFDTLDLQQSRAVEAVKAERLAEERSRYVDFHRALADEDELLLERLAMTELRLKSVNTVIADEAPVDPLAMVSQANHDAIGRALAKQPLMRSIEFELSRPDLKQQATIDVEIERPRRTRLVAAATGEHRPWLAGAGALLLLMGLWPRRAAG